MADRESSPAAAPLDGVRVVDLSRVLAGPYCTMALADHGADVVKVERPGAGDETRAWGPPFADGESAYYLSVNRSKRSCAIDLSDPAGSELGLELCAGADVVVENFRSGTAERLGVGYEQVRERNPGVVYCSITGFGSDREPPGRPGYDFVAQAESGLMSITGSPDGPPCKVGVALVDVLTGLNAAVAVTAALRGGRGARIEVPLLDSGLAGLVNVGQGALVTGTDPARHGNAHPSIVPYEDFAAATGRVVVAAPNDGLFRALCGAIGAGDLPDDERFATNADRVRNRGELIPLLEARFATAPAGEWVERLSAAGVPAGKIRTVPEALEAAAEAGHPATMSVAHPTIGNLELVGPPARIEHAPEPTAPPLLGEHTAEVLHELGRSRAEIEELAERGVLELGAE